MKEDNEFFKSTPSCLGCISYKLYLKSKSLTKDFKKWENKEKENFLKLCLNAFKEMKHVHKTGIPRCMICKKEMVNAIDSKTEKMSPYLWKTTCGHGKGQILVRG